MLLIFHRELLPTLILARLQPNLVVITSISRQHITRTTEVFSKASNILKVHQEKILFKIFVFIQYDDTYVCDVNNRKQLESIKLIILFLPSFRLFTDKMYCLTLYYHMYGTTINQLIISTKNGTNTPVDHWTKTGSQGNTWYKLSGVNLLLDSQTKVNNFTLHTTTIFVQLKMQFSQNFRTSFYLNPQKI